MHNVILCYLHKRTPAYACTCAYMYSSVCSFPGVCTHNCIRTSSQNFLCPCQALSRIRTPVLMPTRTHVHLCTSIHTTTLLPLYTTHMLKASGPRRPGLTVSLLHDTGSSCSFWWLVHACLSELEVAQGPVCFISSCISEFSKLPGPYKSSRDSQMNRCLSCGWH